MPTKNNKKEHSPYIPTSFGVGLAVICFMLLFVGIGVASANDYYVSLSGNDANNGTTLDTAWRTIDHSVDHVSAGDTIFVVPGNYGAEHVTITTSGTESNPIKITRYDASGLITLKHNVENTGIGIRVYGNYWIIEYFDVSDYYYDVFISGDYNILNFCEAYGNSDEGFMVDCTGDYNVFNGCVAHDITNTGFGLMGTNNLIKDCVVSGIIGHMGIAIGHGADGNIVDGGNYSATIGDTEIGIAKATNTVIKNVEVHDCKDGIRTYYISKNTTITNCYIHDMVCDSAPPRQGIEMGGSGVVSNNTIRNWGSTQHGIKCLGPDILFFGNDMQGPSTEYRFHKTIDDPNNPETPTPDSCENITIENQEGTSFNIVVTNEPEVVENPSITIKYTDGRTFSVNGDGEYTNHTLNSIGTFNIEVIGGVSTGTILGTVTGKDTGTPIEGATVSANSHSDTTNSTGGYTITLPVGTYTVTASKTGYQSQSQENVQVLEDQTTTVNFLLTLAPDDLIGLWHFEEGEGITAVDSSGQGNDGTLTNMDPATDWVDGKVGDYALSFDGTDDYVDCGISASLIFNDSDPWSFEHWIQWAGQQDKSYVIYAGLGSEVREYFVIKNNGNNRFAFRDKNSNYHSFASGSSSPYIGKWTHLTWIADGNGNLTLYINGEYYNTLSSVPTQMHFYRIGRSYYCNDYNFKGTIDEVRIYNRALSAEEILAHYEAGVVKTYPCYDVNEDGKVDILDTTIVEQHFGETTYPPYPRYDVNEDGKVDILDTTIVGQHYGEITS